MDPIPPHQGNESQPVMANLAYQTPLMTPPPRRRSWGRRILILGFFASAGFLLLFVLVIASNIAKLDDERPIREAYFSHERRSDNKIAIISVVGTILSGDGFVKRQIDQAADDPSIKAIVLRVDSPGGTVTGSDYIYHHLCELATSREKDGGQRIPIVVSMGGLAASGGYYVSMAVGDTPDSIFAEPTTWTGSIGVIIPHYDLSKLLTKWGIEQDSIVSDEFKGMGSFAKAMTPEEEAIFQELVDESFNGFKEIIKNGRPDFRDNPDDLDAIATGRIFTASQAEKNGLVDKIGFIEAAIERAIELAGVPADDVTVVKYRRDASLASLLMGGQAKSPSLDLAKTLQLTSGRACYMSTWLPPLAGSVE